MKKTLIFIFCYLVIIFITFSQEEQKSIEPLILDISINEEIWMDGEMVVNNGWPPNIKMIVYGNKIIGIDENSIPEELIKDIWNTIKGSYKLKFIRTTNLPYYDVPLLLFEIIEYKNIEIIK